MHKNRPAQASHEYKGRATAASGKVNSKPSGHTGNKNVRHGRKPKPNSSLRT